MSVICIKIVPFLCYFFPSSSLHKTNVRPEDRLFSFMNPLAWSIWISMVSFGRDRGEQESFRQLFFINDENVYNNENEFCKGRMETRN